MILLIVIIGTRDRKKCINSRDRLNEYTNIHIIHCHILNVLHNSTPVQMSVCAQTRMTGEAVQLSTNDLSTKELKTKQCGDCGRLVWVCKRM